VYRIIIEEFGTGSGNSFMEFKTYIDVYISWTGIKVEIVDDCN